MRVNEIFYSLQGEGYFTGTPAVFVRLAGCNLHCEFCDTDHSPHTDMSEEEIVAAVNAYPAKHVVITGGEPGLQLNPLLVAMLHEAGKFVQVETNGTRALPEDVDWITCSPKGDTIVLSRVDELKVLYLPDGPLITGTEGVEAARLSIQPCDTGSPEQNAETLRKATEYILAHPQWRLSLQTHKLIDIK